MAVFFYIFVLAILKLIYIKYWKWPQQGDAICGLPQYFSATCICETILVALATLQCTKIHSKITKFQFFFQAIFTTDITFNWHNSILGNHMVNQVQFWINLHRWKS